MMRKKYYVIIYYLDFKIKHMKLYFIFLFILTSCEINKNKNNQIKFEKTINMVKKQASQDKYKIKYFKMFDFTLTGLEKIAKPFEDCWEFGYNQKDSTLSYIKEFGRRDTIQVYKYNDMLYSSKEFKDDLFGPSTQINFYFKNRVVGFHYQHNPFKDKSYTKVYEISLLENNKIVFYSMNGLNSKSIPPLELIHIVDKFISKNCDESRRINFYNHLNKIIAKDSYNNIDTIDIKNKTKEFIYLSYLM